MKTVIMCMLDTDIVPPINILTTLDNNVHACLTKDQLNKLVNTHAHKSDIHISDYVDLLYFKIYEKLYLLEGCHILRREDRSTGKLKTIYDETVEDELEEMMDMEDEDFDSLRDICTEHGFNLIGESFDTPFNEAKNLVHSLLGTKICNEAWKRAMHDLKMYFPHKSRVENFMNGIKKEGIYTFDITPDREFFESHGEFRLTLVVHCY